jgi:hypothetical protein
MKALLLSVFIVFFFTGYSQKQRLTILGSSSAEGVGASKKDSSWVGRLSNYYKKTKPVIDTLYNLAKRGKDPYFAMPSSYSPPPGRSLPNKDSNITRAVKLNGKYLIVSFSSNNYDVFSFAEIHMTLKTIRDSALKAGMVCYISSSQPRTQFNAAGRLRLKQVKDSIMKWFGSAAINFFDPVVDPTDLSILAKYRYSGDGIHLNDLGHRVLFEQVLAKNIFNSPARLFAILSATNPSCYNQNGVITVTAYGGTLPYSYSKDGGATYQTSNKFTVRAGSYTIRVKDNSGKVVNQSITVTQPALLKATVKFSKIKCGGSSSKDTVFASGGTPPYLYSVNNGTFQTSRYFALKAGSYIFTVKDSKGCIYSSATLVKTEPAPLVVTLVSKSNPTCIGASNGKINVSGSGGSTPYLFQLNTGAFQASGQFANLPAGSYKVTLKDAVGCLRTYGVTLVASTTACTTAAAPTARQAEVYSALKVSPNPTTSDFTVSFFSRTTAPRDLRVYDISGKVVFQRQVNNYQYVRFGDKLQKGIYILQITENGKTSQTKLVKQ